MGMHEIGKDCDRQINRRITVMSFIAAIQVVFIHSKTYISMSAPANWNVFLQNLLYGDWAVPYFFVVAGYFFHKSLLRGDGLVKVLTTKYRTLMLPYFIWVTVGALVSTPLVVCNNYLAQRSSLWERTIFGTDSVVQAIVDVYAIDFFGNPKCLAPLWFVKSLVFMFALTPLWRLLFKYVAKYLWVVAIVLFGFYLGIGGVIGFRVFGILAWFLLGIVIADGGWLQKWCARKSTGVRLVVGGGGYALLSIYFAAVQAHWISPMIIDDAMSILVQICAIAFWWMASGWLRKVNDDRQLPRIVSMSFFIYAAHCLFISWFSACGCYIAGSSDVLRFFVFVLNPWVAILSCYLLGCFLMKRLPRVYAIITGGRAIATK